MVPIAVKTRIAARFIVFSTAFLCLSANAQTLGTGSTLMRDLMTSWTAQYGSASGGARYEPSGSSAGISQARDGSVDFGVTDVPLTAAALQQANLRQMPLAAAAVAVIVNLPELGGKPIKLTGDILGDIFTGTITQWNHSLIASVNPGLPLPNRAIVPVWRADGSGQSYVFSTYIARGNSKWRRTVGSTNNLSQLAGRSVRGGAALLDAVKTTPGAIGYDSLGAAQRAGLGIAELRNSADRFVAPSAATISEALSQAKWASDSLSADLDGSAGAGSYPMSAVTYAVISGNRKGGINPVPFLKTAVSSGDAQVMQAGLIPLPATGKNLANQVR
ncbi:phosphate ABC transporter substrate-binding protein PstS [Variovorax sp. PCZ-1]|uniref:phosphate ABC transporter substrate-binding protein PstS n=1 Tax=Variovorax sp. PCZ-1 TaxID=2835533 RepID=UPI001BCD5A5C|nr:phosphate ABC transporter substrate-binding protein PstS [Variovorax sp. PCZ-1]MBS7808472.1 phosphate ABC transporter substrate-binding protein PstS [Variovorax sp. PCZ-1]